MAKSIEKYKINDFLELLTVKEYRFAMRKIPGLLDVSVNTFHNYRRIKIEEPQDIPYEKIKILEILFGISNGALENKKITGKTLVQLRKGQ